MNTFIKPFHTLLVVLFALQLSACNNSNEKTAMVEGKAVKGIIDQGIVSLYALEDRSNLIAQTRTNAEGKFSFSAEETSAIALKDKPVFIELSVDENSRMLCDLPEGCYESITGSSIPFSEWLRLPSYFTLLSAKLANNNEANISPLSHLIIGTAMSLEGGLNESNIQSARAWVQETLGITFDPLTTNTADLTQLGQSKAAYSYSIAELEQGILSASLFEQSLDTSWSTSATQISEQPVAEILQKAAEIAQALADTTSLTDVDNETRNSLNWISQTNQQLANNLTSRVLSIHNQPSSMSLEEGDSLALFVTASGEGTLQYQWFKNSMPIPGANAASFGIANTSLSDGGIYHVRVGDDNGEIDSLSALVNVQAKPSAVSITSQPSAITLNEGQTISLSVAAMGDGPLSYQWQKNGSILPNANEKDLIIPLSRTSDSGSYRVTVSNSFSSMDSNFVTVTVNEPLIPPQITQQPQHITVTEGDAAQFSVVASGSGFLSYQWRKDSTSLDNAFSSTLDINNVTLSDAGTYDVLVVNSQGTVSSQSAILTVLPLQVPLSAERQPVSQDLFVGEDLVLSFGVSGDGPISYQWLFNGQEIYGANSSSLSISSTSLDDSGEYAARAWNDISEVLSSPATIDIRQRPSVLLSWEAPTIRENGTLINEEDIAQFVVEYGFAPNQFIHSIRTHYPEQREVLITELNVGPLYIRIATIDSDGLQSVFSPVSHITIE